MFNGLAYVTTACWWNVGTFNTYYGLPFPSEKKPFTRNKPDTYDVVEGINGSMIPLRLVKYNTGIPKGRGRIKVMGQGYAVILARDPEAELSFFEVFGLRKNRSIRVDARNKIAVFTEQLAVIDPMADIAGYSCIGFYSTDIDSDLQRLIEAGGRNFTNPYIVKIGQSERETVTLRSPEGTIIELVRRVG